MKGLWKLLLMIQNATEDKQCLGAPIHCKEILRTLHVGDPAKESYMHDVKLNKDRGNMHYRKQI